MTSTFKRPRERQRASAIESAAFQDVLEAVGRRGDALSEARAALELFTAKGHRPGIEKARALLADLAASV